MAADIVSAVSRLPRPTYFELICYSCLCLSIHVVLVVLYRTFLSPLRRIPGPLLGSFSVGWWLWHVLVKGDCHWATIDLHKKHGPFVRLTHREVSVNHPDAVRKVLLAPLEKSSWYKIFNIPDSRYPNQMGECVVARHVQKQRNIASGYTMSSLVMSEPRIDAAIELFQCRIDGFSGATPMHLDEWFTYFAFDVIGELTFSQDFGFLRAGKDIGDSIATNGLMLRYITFMGHFHQLHDFLMSNPLVEWLHLQPAKHIFRTAEKAIAARESAQVTQKDMMGAWRDSLEKHPERMTEREIHSAAIGNIVAGSDSVSTQLQAFLYHLLHNPNFMARLREELDTADARGALSSPVAYNETLQLPYFQACIKEAERMHPTFMNGFPRIVPPEGLTIGEQKFPAGTILSVNPWVIHHNPELFGTDADQFNPERWLAPGSKAMEKNLITYGAGYNQCLGRHTAIIQLRKLLTTLVRNYDMELGAPGEPWKTAKSFVVKPYGWTCLLTRRVGGKVDAGKGV